MTREGTNHFSGLTSAIAYYESTGYFDLSFSHKEKRRLTLAKIENKEIAIGKPAVFADERLYIVAGRYGIEIPETYRMGVKVHLSNGDYILTEINGTQRSVSKYYLGNTFDGAIAEKVEFLS